MRTALDRLGRTTIAAIALLILLLPALPASAQMEETTRRADDEGILYDRLVIRGATLINGNGAPPIGPVDIVIENDIITEVRTVGYPGLPLNTRGRPAAGTREIDWTGKYVMPGLVDMHAHTGGAPKAPQAEYVHKLWLAHGITTSRGVGHGGLTWSLEQAAMAESGEIAAPRMFTYARPGDAWEGGAIDTPEKAREWVRFIAEYTVDGADVDGLKLTSFPPAIMAALIDEAHQHGLGTVAHLAQMGVGELTAMDAAEMGLDQITHFYGLFESMLDNGYTIQDYPLDYNYQNEQHRFGQVARLWSQSAEPGSDKWNETIDRFIELGFSIDPTMTIYEASRDLMRAMQAEWHAEYTLPSLWDYYTPSRAAHGSYWFYWTSEDESEWQRFYNKWMTFLNDFKNAGGVVTTGSDSGFIYKLFGFDYIRELELLREAGFHPLEVIRAATMHGAQQLYEPRGMENEIPFGLVQPGMKADLVLVHENPLENLKVLYGTGGVRLNDETGEVGRTEGIGYTIANGRVYDVPRLLAEVREMVAAQKRERSITDGAGAGGN